MVHLCYATELQQLDRLELDDAIFELLGVADIEERKELLASLYQETALYFREGRVVELQAMENRSKKDNRRFNAHDLAADIWDAAQLEDATPLGEWIGQLPESDSLVNIPDERPAIISNDVMFSPSTVFFGKSRQSFSDCQSRGQAELVARVANLGISGNIKLPAELSPCLKLLDRVDRRISIVMERFTELIESRTSDDRIRQQLTEVLQRWFVLGRETSQSGNMNKIEDQSDS